MSKIQNSTFVRPIEKKMQEKFENCRLRFVGGVGFWIIAPIGFMCVNENEKYS